MWKLQTDEDGAECWRVDLANFAMGLGIAQLALLWRVPRGAGGGLGPGRLCRDAGIRRAIKALRSCFAREHGGVALLNQLMGMWASRRIGSADRSAASGDHRRDVRSAAA